MQPRPKAGWGRYCAVVLLLLLRSHVKTPNAQKARNTRQHTTTETNNNSNSVSRCVVLAAPRPPGLSQHRQSSIASLPRGRSFRLKNPPRSLSNLVVLFLFPPPAPVGRKPIRQAVCQGCQTSKRALQQRFPKRRLHSLKHPALCPGPRILQSIPAEPIQQVAVGLGPLGPNSDLGTSGNEVRCRGNALHIGIPGRALDYHARNCVVVHEPHHIPA